MNTVFTTQQVAPQLSGNGHTNGHNNVHSRQPVKSSESVAFSDLLGSELKDAMARVGAFGSVEIYIQDYHVTQITARSIKKTKHKID